MSIEITTSETPPTLDVRTAADVFADIDLRAVYLSALSGNAVNELAVQTLDRLSDADFVALLYTEILRREAEPGAVDFWTGVLGNGASRDDLLDTFAASPESLSISSPDQVALLGQHFAQVAALTDAIV